MIYSLKLVFNETQKIFTNMIPYLQKDKIIFVMFAFCFPYEWTAQGNSEEAVNHTAAGKCHHVVFLIVSDWYNQVH